MSLVGFAFKLLAIEEWRQEVSAGSTSAVTTAVSAILVQGEPPAQKVADIAEGSLVRIASAGLTPTGWTVIVPGEGTIGATETLARVLSLDLNTATYALTSEGWVEFFEGTTRRASGLFRGWGWLEKRVGIPLRPTRS